MANGQKSWLDRLLEEMDVAGDAIIDFVKNPFAQPRCLTALGGLLALVGTIFPWTYAGGLGFSGKTFAFTGFTHFPGMIIAVSGLGVILLAIFRRTEPGKANSLASSILALIDFFIGCVLPFFSVCLDCGSVLPLPGFGSVLSAIAVLLTFFLGLIPNPKPGG